MSQHTFQQVDVFTDAPFKGNPAAVVFDGDALSTERMQAIAHWTNLSETTFVCKPTQSLADYRLRIFTPRSELRVRRPSHHRFRARGVAAWVDPEDCPGPPRAGMQGKGLVQLQIDGDLRFLSVPPPAFDALSGAQLAALAAALGLIETAGVRANPRASTSALPGSTLQITKMPTGSRAYNPIRQN